MVLLLFVFLLGTAIGVVIVQNSADLRQRASVDPYCTSADIAALQYACGSQGYSLQTCSCNSVNPTSVPPTNIPSSTPIVENNICVPGTSTCTDGVFKICTNSSGSYSIFNCPNGCNGNACAPYTQLQITAQPSIPDSCVPGTSLCSGSTQYTCTNSNGNYTSSFCQYGCANNRCLLKPTASPISVTPKPSRIIFTLAPTQSPQSKIAETTPIIPTAIPTAAILPEVLVGPNGNVCYCKENGFNVACKNQSVCCSNNNFFSREYVKDRQICETNNSLVRVPGVVQTDTAYVKNGCGPATIANVLIDSGKTTLPDGQPITLDSVIDSYYYFSKPTDKTGLQQNLAAAQAIQPDSFIMVDQIVKDKNSLTESEVIHLMQEQVANGDKLIVGATVKNVQHWFLVTSIDETGVYGIDSYFDGDGTPNFDDEAGFVEYQSLGVDFSISQIIVVPEL